MVATTSPQQLARPNDSSVGVGGQGKAHPNLHAELELRVATSHSTSSAAATLVATPSAAAINPFMCAQQAATSSTASSTPSSSTFASRTPAPDRAKHKMGINDGSGNSLPEATQIRMHSFASKGLDVLEVCCGTAGVSAACIRAGLVALGVDVPGNRHRAQAPWLAVDFATAEGLQLLLGIQASSNLCLLWFGLPCGTASRAREIHNAPGLPLPLRSPKEPWGIASQRISAADRLRLSIANAVYRNALFMVKQALSQGTHFVIENPANSLLWYLPEMVALLDEPGVADAVYDACMVGGRRRKSQRLRTNNQMIIKALNNKTCDGQHSHLPWKTGSVLHTAEEAAYPSEFCDLIASCIKKRTDAEPKLADNAASDALAAARRPKIEHAAKKAAVGMQPGYSLYPALVLEYKDIVVVPATAEELQQAEEVQACNKGWVLKKQVFCSGSLEPNTRILQCLKNGEEVQNQRKAGLVRIGIPWTEQEFCHEVCKQVHPFDLQARVEDRSLFAVHSVLTRGISGTLRARNEELQKWRSRAKVLDDQEVKLYDQAPRSVQACWSNGLFEKAKTSNGWKGKRTLLFEEMAAAAGVPDPGLLAGYLREGAPMLGEVTPCGLFETKRVEPTRSFAQILQASNWSKPVLAATTRPSANPEVDEEIVMRTEEEVRDGKATGPHTEQEMDAMFPEGWAPVRRVGLVQSAGIRPIDDFSEFGHNDSSGTDEHVDLGGVDAVAGITKAWSEAVKADGTVRTKYKDGTKLVGRLHQDFAGGRHRRILGRALDLHRAYKQVPISPGLRRFAVICVWHPRRRSRAYYVLNALPFGARNAVFTFGALARSLELVLTVLFSFTVTQYVDDYPQLELAALAGSGCDAVQVLGLLGWEVKRPEGMLPLFSRSFSALGVEFDLREVTENNLYVRDKPGRAKKIGDLVEQLCAGSKPSATLAETLRGVLGFMRAQCFGRCGAVSLHPLSRIAANRVGKLTEDDRAALRFWPAYLAEARPRTVKMNCKVAPVILFTDGAEEEDGDSAGTPRVGVGAVLLDRHRGKFEFFGGQAPRDVVEAWRLNGSRKVIHQAELWPVVLALELWAGTLKGRRVIVLVDNDGARGALVKCTTTNLASARLVNQFWSVAAQHEVYPWVDRVPTRSNCADGPSRGGSRWLVKAGYEQVMCPALCGFK